MQAKKAKKDKKDKKAKAEKRCTKCRKMLPLTDFYKSARSKDGRRWRCKKCCFEYMQQAHKENPELRKALAERSNRQMKERREDPAYNEDWLKRNRASQKKWLDGNKELFAERRSVNPIKKLKNRITKKQAVIKTLLGRLENLRASVKQDRIDIKKLEV